MHSYYPRIVHRKYHRGFGIVELMVSITVASLLSLAAVKTFTSQSNMFTDQIRRNQMVNDGRNSYEIISRLLRQAQSNSIVINSVAGNTTVEFVIPSGFAIWPNDTSPFTNNVVSMQWQDSGLFANQLRIASAASSAALAGAAFNTLLGSNMGTNTQVTNFTMVDNGAGTFQIAINLQSGTNGPATSFQGEIIPRN